MTSNTHSINTQFYRVFIWLSRDPIEERGGVNLYGFVGNDGVNKWDKLGLMKNVSYDPVMVAIFMTRVDLGASVNTTDMMRLLQKGMDRALKWDLTTGPIPSGRSKGKQSSKRYKGKCYRHVYYVNVTLSSIGGGMFPLGYGLDFDAVLWADRTKISFDINKLSPTLDKKVATLGRDEAYKRIGGFLLTHEVLHAVGAKHQKDEQSRFIMISKPTWNWIVRWPFISQQTVNRVKIKLDVKPR